MAGGGGGITKQFTLDDVAVRPVAHRRSGRCHPDRSGGWQRQASGNRTTNSRSSAGNENGKDAAAGTIEQGRWFSRGEVVGQLACRGHRLDVRDEFFPGQNPIGAELDIDGQRVHGHRPACRQGRVVRRQPGQRRRHPRHDRAADPRTPRTSRRCSSRCSTPSRVEAVKAQVQRILEPRFGDQFTVFTQEQTLGILSTLLGTLTAMLAGLASISLARRRHRHHEHHAGQRVREDPRDRHPQGGRRAHVRHPEPVRHRGDGALGAGRRDRHPGRCRRARSRCRSGCRRRSRSGPWRSRSCSRRRSASSSASIRRTAPRGSTRSRRCRYE